MKVERVELLNFDFLYECMVSQQNNEQFKNAQLGVHFPELMSHVSVVLELSEVSDFEYIFLKIFSGGNISKRLYKQGDHRIDLDIWKKQFPEISLSLESLYRLIESIPNVENYYENIVPMGLLASRVVIILSGIGLSTLISLSPRLFFIQATKGKCLLESYNNEDEKKLNPLFNVYDNENSSIISDYIIQNFITKFYRSFVDSISNKDVVCDALNYTHYFSKIKTDNFIQFNYISNPFIMFDILSDDIEQVINKIHNYKNIINDLIISNDEKTRILDSTCMECILSTSISVFTEFMEILPINRFTVMSSWAIPITNSYNSDGIFEWEDGLKKYSHQLNGRISSISNDIRKIYFSDKDLLKKILLTKGNTQYKYMMKISFNDIDRYLRPYFNNTKSKVVEFETDHYIKKIIDYVDSFKLEL